ncbi:hypothetical protein IID20_00575 [Patescibacteria group bacterium]|nr:hypothetical protein [Patescibacteria group bacterium]
MTKNLIFLISFLLIFLLTIPITNFTIMAFNPDFSAWPAITHCVICEKRVYVWQEHERRTFRKKLDNPAQLRIQVISNSIVHQDCQGEPAGPPIKIVPGSSKPHNQSAQPIS